MNSFLLLGVGLLMIFLEFYLPGGIMGTLGVLIVLGSVILFVSESNSLIEVVFFIIGATAALVILFRFALWRIRHAPPDRSIYSDQDQEGFVASAFDREAIGKRGIVETDLRPGGHILVEGKKHLAISQSGYLSKGEEIEIVDGQGESLIVKKVKL